MKTFIEIETIRSGQPRAYADHERVYTVKIEHELLYGPNKGQRVPWDYATPEEFQQSQFAKLGGGWVDEGEGDWASTRLVRITKLEPGKFQVHTRAAFTD